MHAAFEMTAQIAAVDPMVISLKAAVAGQLPESKLAGLEVALSEALVNIVVHAVKPPYDKPVSIEVKLDAETATFVISDKGASAPPDLFENATSLDLIDVMAEGGRGVSLIRFFADDVSYCSSEGVNRLTLVFERKESQ
ncbi:ATP-binding protein [Hoeflea sp. AS60]|uniref:ATP-binding protein n=1 Tax=Hoeflea sp. AS60 TaxID=3135780 RepID=UPI003173A6A9